MKESKTNFAMRKCLLTRRMLLFLVCSLLSVVAVHAQIQISGKVQDENNDPLVGVSVTVVGETIGTTTELDGTFSLKVPNENSRINFSFIGLMPHVEKVGSKREFSVTLKDDQKILGEVVVVGYGTQKKENLTGAVASVDAKTFETRPITNVASALQGVAAGVNIAPTTGNPNTAVGFNIRGTTSINGGSPLVLIDGVEMDARLLNPNDIANVSILKDAASSAIYGVRAAFGVILITTKKGNAGGGEKLTVNYSANFAWEKPTIMPEMVDNSYDHAKFINAAKIRAGTAAMYTDDHMAGIEAYYKDPQNAPPYFIDANGTYKLNAFMDWKGMVMRDYKPKQTHNVNVSGGSGKTSFYASFGHTNQEGFWKINPDVLRRNNVRFNMENRTYNWLKFGLQSTYSASKYDEPFNYKDASWHQVIFTSPLRPYRWDGDPNYPQHDIYKGMYFDDQNPVSLLELGGRTVERRSEFSVTPSIDITPLKNWNIHLDFTYLRMNTNKTQHRKKVDMIKNSFLPTEGNTSNNSYEENNTYRNYYSFNAYTDYEKTFNKKHYLKGMVGYNQELTTQKANGSKILNLISQDVPTTSLGLGDRTTTASGYEWALRGGFARINYVYDSKYLFEINGRYDGTSRFPKDDRFVFLPSFSLGWRLSEESFMSFSKPIFDNIKLRMSYGKLGNQMMTAWGSPQSDYSYIPFLTSGLSDYYMFNGGPNALYINPSGLIPKSLTWEKAATLNGGIDLTLLKQRLDMTFDIYRRTTSDMLYRQAYPELLGASAPYINGGELQTSGWELTADWKDRIGQDFSYNVGFTLYDSQSKITKFDGAVASVDNNYKGKKIGEIWGYISDGIMQTQEEVDNAPKPSWGSNWGIGDQKFVNQDDNTGVISSGANRPEDHGDKVVIGNTTARYRYNIRLGAEYKGIFLNAFLQGVGKRDFYVGSQSFRPAGTEYFAVQKWHITDSWSEDNRNAYHTLPKVRDGKNYDEKNTRFLQDASYLRMKNLTVGYSIPKEWLKPIKLSRAQVYFSGENLFEKKNTKGPIDPEGVDNTGGMYYPFSRTYSFGIDLTF